jgi:TonB family protein
MSATSGVIHIEGDIASSDVEQFRRISLQYPEASVTVNSRGGLVLPAIEIGKIIKVMGYRTTVYHNGVCASACALIWIAGSERSLSYDGHVGFHASYRNAGGRLMESGVANALVGNYLTLLGLSAKAIVFATTAPPDKVLWLTNENKAQAGFDFEIEGPPPVVVIPLPPESTSPDRQTLVKASSVTPPAPRPAAPSGSNFQRGFPAGFVPVPPPRFTPKGPSPEGNPANWTTGNDYPARALREEREGTTGFRVTVSTDGRVTDCQITSSSGHADLDEATCANVRQRARFTPATDGEGQPTNGSYSNRVRWVIPSDLEPASPPPLPTASAPPPPPLMFDDIPETRQPRNWQWSNAPTAPWVLVATTAAGGKYYVNQDTFNPYSTFGWEFWTKMDASGDVTKKFRDQLTLQQINCSRKRIRQMSVIEHNKIGKVIYSWHEDYNPQYEAILSIDKSIPIAPDTLGDTLYRSVCQ